MIPFGLLSGFMDSKEIRITELGEDGFRFRLTEECPEPEQFRICFYDMKKAGYRKVEIRKFEMNAVAGTLEAEERCVQENDGSFFREYSVRVEQKDYVQEVQRLAGEYSRYIRLKLDGDDGELAKTLTGYPAELDEVHCESLEEQKKVWFSGIGKETFVTLQNGFVGSGQPGQPVELALELDRPEWYEAYLSMESAVFFDAYFRKNQIPDPPLFHPDRLYIGNAFCPHLAPTEEELFALMDKACRESFAVTLVFPFLLEGNLLETQQRLQRLVEWCEQKNKIIEIVVNDWGTAHLAAQLPVFSLCLGVLLNKRKKDPRMAYKLGDRTLFEQNSVHAAFYREYLKEEFRMERYEWESCGDTSTRKFPEGKNSLRLPFYQTNTSQFALCMQRVPKEATEPRCRYASAQSFVKGRRFCIRSICGWWGGIIHCSGWI